MSKILVAEDNPATLNVISQLLSENGYEVALAPDGSRALELLEEDNFDLVLSDISMPYDGYRLLREIRSTRIPLIFMTGRPEDRSKVLSLGARDFLQKPFGVEELLRKIKSVL